MISPLDFDELARLRSLGVSEVHIDGPGIVRVSFFPLPAAGAATQPSTPDLSGTTISQETEQPKKTIFDFLETHENPGTAADGIASNPSTG